MTLARSLFGRDERIYRIGVAPARSMTKGDSGTARPSADSQIRPYDLARFAHGHTGRVISILLILSESNWFAQAADHVGLQDARLVGVEETE